jgi:hypothetical protein
MVNQFQLYVTHLDFDRGIIVDPHPARNFRPVQAVDRIKRRD